MRDRLPGHLGVRRRRSCARWPTRRTARRSSSPGPTGRAAAGAGSPPRRSPTPPASSGIELDQPESVNDEAARARIAAAAPEAVVRVRVRGADQGAAALRLPDAQRPSVAAAALARRGAGRARDHGRRRADRGLDHAPDRGPGQRAGVPAGATSRSRPTTPTARWPRGWRRSAAELLVEALDELARAVPRAGRGAASPTPRRSPPRTGGSIPTRPAAELERVVRALHPHIGAAGRARRRRAARRLGGARAPARAGDPAAGELVARRRRCRSLGCADGALELIVVQPPGERAMAGEDYLRGRGAERVDARPDSRASRRRGSAPTRSCAACSSTAPTPTARCTPRRAGSSRASARWRWRSPTAPCSAGRRSTTCSPRCRAGRLERLDPPVLAALRSGLLQMLFLDGVADHAAVNETVELVKRDGRGGARPGQRRPAPRHPRGPRRSLAALGRRTPEHGGGRCTRSPRGWPSCGGASSGAERARALLAAINRAGRVGAARQHAGGRPRTTVAAAAAASPSRPAPGLPEALVLEGAVRRLRLAAVGARGDHAPVAGVDARGPGAGPAARASGCSTCAPPPGPRRPIWPR